MKEEKDHGEVCEINFARAHHQSFAINFCSNRKVASALKPSIIAETLRIDLLLNLDIQIGGTIYWSFLATHKALGLVGVEYFIGRGRV